MILFLFYEEHTDNNDGEGTRTYADLVTDVIRNPHTERPQGESEIAEIARQYA